MSHSLLIRAEGLDTMIVVRGAACGKVIGLIQKITPSDRPEATFYSVLNELLLSGVRNAAVVDTLPADADFLLRVDGEKILVRETTPHYAHIPGWSKIAAPLVAIYPLGQGPVGPTWTAGDPSLKSLEALETFIAATPGLGPDFSRVLRIMAAAARGKR